MIFSCLTSLTCSFPGIRRIQSQPRLWPRQQPTEKCEWNELKYQLCLRPTVPQILGSFWNTKIIIFSAVVMHKIIANHNIYFLLKSECKTWTDICNIDKMPSNLSWFDASWFDEILLRNALVSREEQCWFLNVSPGLHRLQWLSVQKNGLHPSSSCSAGQYIFIRRSITPMIKCHL